MLNDAAVVDICGIGNTLIAALFSHPWLTNIHHDTLFDSCRHLCSRAGQSGEKRPSKPMTSCATLCFSCPRVHRDIHFFSEPMASIAHRVRRMGMRRKRESVPMPARAMMGAMYFYPFLRGAKTPVASHLVYQALKRVKANVICTIARSSRG